MSPLPARPPGVAVAVDVVMLSLRPRGGAEDAELVVLGRRREREPFAGVWALPGGLLREHEDLEQAVRRALSHATPLEAAAHLEQLATFGHPRRDPRGRVLTVSYLALLPAPAAVHDGAAWLPAARPPTLAFDHRAIVDTALERLRGKLGWSNVAYGLLGETFTLRELQSVYEAVLDLRLDKRNFRKKVLSLRMVDEAEGMRRGAHRPAQLYRFRQRELVVLGDVIGG